MSELGGKSLILTTNSNFSLNFIHFEMKVQEFCRF